MSSLTEARRKALDLLARREHSREELRLKLLARGFAPALVAAALTQLTREGLLSDERFVEAFIHGRAARGYGPLRIRQELRQRGVDEELIASHLVMDGPQWQQVAREARRKRFGASLPVDSQDQARQARFLIYRGFTKEQVQEACGCQEDNA